MGIKWSLEDVKKVLEEAGKVMGLSPALIPVKISTRMEKTMGSFLYREREGVISPYEFRFSAILLSGKFEDQVVKDVILHEYAHFYANVQDQRNHNHDDYFKSICTGLGAPTHTYFKELISVPKKKGYLLICKNCKKTVAKRRRRDAVENIIKNKISTCCQSKISCHIGVF